MGYGDHHPWFSQHGISFTGETCGCNEIIPALLFLMNAVFMTDLMTYSLQFEWAWQHPSTSHKLKHIKAPPGCKHGFKFRFYVVSEMLRTGPWNRLPLTIRQAIRQALEHEHSVKCQSASGVECHERKARQISVSLLGTCDASLLFAFQ